MTIQWYPGHMLEAKNDLKNAISKVDAILEILDARLPCASANPIVSQICKNKFILKVLNKKDLADPEITQEWLNYFENRLSVPAIAISGLEKSQTDNALNYCMKKIIRNRARKIKIMVIGIPNTGKSTILNSLAGKRVARTGNVPAITRHQQRTSLKNNIDLYDTPGILWPVIEPEAKAFMLAASGAISDTAIDYTDLAIYASTFLLKSYPQLITRRFSFLNGLPEDALSLIENIGKARGCLKKGGLVNCQKASETLIRELRAGKIGRISFESPKDLKK